MNWYRLIYWITVADGVKNLIQTLAIVFLIMVVVAVIVSFFVRLFENADGDDHKDNLIYKWAKKSLRLNIPLAIVFWLLNIFVPGKMDVITIVVGGSVGNFVEHDSTTRALPKDLSNFLSAKLHEWKSEAEHRAEHPDASKTHQDSVFDKLAGHDEGPDHRCSEERFNHLEANLPINSTELPNPIPGKTESSPFGELSWVN